MRGFGFLHSGGIDTVFRFVSVVTFTDAFVPAGFALGPEGEAERRDSEAFLLAFDTNLAPIVGQQVTLTRDNGSAVAGRIDLLIVRASTEGGAEPHSPECELVVTTRRNGLERGWLYLEAFPSEVEGNYVPVHTYLLAQHGIPIMEVVYLEELSRDGVYEFAFIGTSLKLRGSDGAPMRPIALPLRASRSAG